MILLMMKICGRSGFSPWVRKIPWRRNWQSTPVFLPGKSHRWRSLADYSQWVCKESDMTEQLHFHILWLIQTLLFTLYSTCTQWKWNCQSLSRIQLFVTPWTVAWQVPLSMAFFRQEYWSGLPCPPPRNLPNQGIKLGSPALQADSLPSEPPGKLHMYTINML